MTELTLKPGCLTLAQLRTVHAGPVRLQLDASAGPAIDASVACVEQIIAQDRTAYGINTGFGLLASTRIASHDLENLQRSLVLSHAAGIGAPLDDALVRLIMVLKINSLSRGFSGIRRKVIDALIALVNAEVYPHIPLKGSVGASGDLAPLAHMSLVLLGEGKARYKGQWLAATEALAIAGLEPLTLAAKEGLALLNGTQASTAYALRGLFHGEDLFAAAVTCGALSVEAALGSRSPFDARIHAVRGQRGQIDTAACFRALLGDTSEVYTGPPRAAESGRERALARALSLLRYGGTNVGEERRVWYVALTRARHKAYIISDTGHELSPHFDELMRNEDGAYDVSSTELSEYLKSTALRVPCPRCAENGENSAVLMLRSGRNGSFASCTSFVAGQEHYCGHTERACETCGSGLMARDGNGRASCSNPGCGQVVPLCRCSPSKPMVVRRNKTTGEPFWGCQSFGAGGSCKETRSLNDPTGVGSRSARRRVRASRTRRRSARSS